MNTHALMQMVEFSNRQNAVGGDQDISIYGIDESTIEQSLRCSLQLSQSNNLKQAQTKQQPSKFLFHNKQLSRLSPPKNDYIQNQKIDSVLGGSSKYLSQKAIPVEYGNNYHLSDKQIDLRISQVDHSVVLQKNKDLQEDENLIKLVSEHLIQSIQFLSKRQNHLSTSYLETEGEDVPDEDVEVHTIKSGIVGPNLLNQKNETTDMEKVKYHEQNFTQLWFQRFSKCMNDQQQWQQQYSQQSSKQTLQEITDSDTDQETPFYSQPTIYKRGSGFDTPIITRNQGKRKVTSFDESKICSQQISKNSFSEDQSSDSNDQDLSSNNLDFKQQQLNVLNKINIDKTNTLRKNIKQQQNIENLKTIIDTEQQSLGSPQKYLTNQKFSFNNTNSDNNELKKCKKLNFPQGLNSINQKKEFYENSPPFSLIKQNDVNSFIVPTIDNQTNMCGSTMDETYDLHQQTQFNKQFEENNHMNQKLNSLMQNSILTNKKKSNASQQSNINQNGGKNIASHGVRFDQNVEFFDSNLDLLKYHQDQSMQMQQSQNFISEQNKGTQQSMHLNSKMNSSKSIKQNNLNYLQSPQVSDQRSPEIQSQNIIQEGWLLKKSTNKMLNTYQKRYFILTSEKLFYSNDMNFKKVKGCINIKYLTCYTSLVKYLIEITFIIQANILNKGKQNPKKLHLRITEMKKLLKLKEIIPGDIQRWFRNLQQVISYYSDQEKVMINDDSVKNNYKRDVITESDLESMAQTGDLIIYNYFQQSFYLFINSCDPERIKINYSCQREMGMLIKFNNNDLRVFYLDKTNTIRLHHWEKFIQENDIYNSLIFRKIETSDRNHILPFVYESVRQYLNDNYKKKLKDSLSENHEDLKQLPIIQRNSQLIASIYQKAGLIKASKNIQKYAVESFSQKKLLKLTNKTSLSNEITVMLKRHIFFGSENSDMD